MSKELPDSYKENWSAASREVSYLVTLANAPEIKVGEGTYRPTSIDLLYRKEGYGDQDWECALVRINTRRVVNGHLMPELGGHLFMGEIGPVPSWLDDIIARGYPRN